MVLYTLVNLKNQSSDTQNMRQRWKPFGEFQGSHFGLNGRFLIWDKKKEKQKGRMCTKLWNLITED